MILAAFAFVCAAPIALDGDTFACGQNRVRIFGIEAPELSSGGRVSQANLQKLINGGLQCVSNGTTSYNRIVALCMNTDKQDIGEQQIRQGHAEEWCKYSKGRYEGCE